MTGVRAGAGVDLVCAFMNTLDGADDHAEPGAFAAWLVDHGGPADTAPGDDDVVLARRLRDALRALARANQDAPVDRAALDELNRVAGEVGLRAGFTPAVGVEIASAAVGVRGVLGSVLAAVAVAMADGSWQRVKVCGNADCADVFYDQSRNRSGRWCTMAVCGNRIKARTFRERHVRSTTSGDASHSGG